MKPFRAAQPHGPLEEVFADVFVVTGGLRFGPLLATRNMTVLRQGRELTLINSVRLDDDGERALEKLGDVKHLVRLGWFHGMDDPYYMAKYTPAFWSGARMVPVNVDEAVRNDLREGPSPFGTCFRFRAGRYDEGALVLDVDGGVLVTCDSVQNVVDTRGCSRLGGVMLRAVGLVGGVRLGGPWMKRMTGGAPRQLLEDFTRLTSLPFKHLLSGHGVPRRDDAREQLAADVAKRLAKRLGARA